MVVESEMLVLALVLALAVARGRLSPLGASSKAAPRCLVTVNQLAGGFWGAGGGARQCQKPACHFRRRLPIHACLAQHFHPIPHPTSCAHPRLHMPAASLPALPSLPPTCSLSVAPRRCPTHAPTPHAAVEALDALSPRSPFTSESSDHHRTISSPQSSNTNPHPSPRLWRIPAGRANLQPASCALPAKSTVCPGSRRKSRPSLDD